MHRLPGVDAPARRIKRSRRLVGEKDVDAGERLTGDDLVPDEVPALVVAALSELERDALDLRPREGGSAAAGV